MAVSRAAVWGPRGRSRTHRIRYGIGPGNRRLRARAAPPAPPATSTRTYLETHRDHLRPGDLCTAAFVVVQAVEAITHAAVLHRPELLESDILLDKVTELVVRYLEPPPADSASALSNPAM